MVPNVDLIILLSCNSTFLVSLIVWIVQRKMGGDFLIMFQFSTPETLLECSLVLARRLSFEERKLFSLGWASLSFSLTRFPLATYFNFLLRRPVWGFCPFLFCYFMFFDYLSFPSTLVLFSLWFIIILNIYKDKTLTIYGVVDSISQDSTINFFFLSSLLIGQLFLCFQLSDEFLGGFIQPNSYWSKRMIFLLLDSSSPCPLSLPFVLFVSMLTLHHPSHPKGHWEGPSLSLFESWICSLTLCCNLHYYTYLSNSLGKSST